MTCLPKPWIVAPIVAVLYACGSEPSETPADELAASTAEALPGVGGGAGGAALPHVGVFRSTTGEWFADTNGNRFWDGPPADAYRPNGAFGGVNDLALSGWE